MQIAQTITKAKRTLFQMFKESFCLYRVVNESFGTVHYCLTFKSALEWLQCYNAQTFGATSIYLFNGTLIAQIS